MNCEQIRKLLTSYLLGDLAGATNGEIASHIRDCAGCRAAAQEIEPTLDLLRDALAAPSPVQPPKHLSADRHAYIMAAFDQPVPEQDEEKRWWIYTHHKALAAAAALMIVCGGFTLLLQDLFRMGGVGEPIPRALREEYLPPQPVAEPAPPPAAIQSFAEEPQSIPEPEPALSTVTSERSGDSEPGKTLEEIRAIALQKIAKLDPGDPAYGGRLAQLQHGLGHDEQAWQLYLTNEDQVAREFKALDPDFVNWVIDRNTSAGRFDKAESLARSVIQWIDSTPNALSKEARLKTMLSYANIAKSKPEYPRAKAIYHHIAAAKEFNGLRGQVDAELQIADIDLQTGARDEAVNRLEKLLKNQDRRTQAEANYLLAKVRFEQRDYAATRDALAKVFTITPDHPEARILEAKTQLGLRRVQDATKVKKVGIRSQPRLVLGKPLEISLEDSTLSVVGRSPVIEVRAWTDSGDEETFLIKPHGDSKTQFKGQIPTKLAATKKGDGVLQVLGGDKVHYDYSPAFTKEADIAASEETIRVTTDSGVNASSVPRAPADDPLLAELTTEIIKTENVSGGPGDDNQHSLPGATSPGRQEGRRRSGAPAVSPDSDRIARTDEKRSRGAPLFGRLSLPTEPSPGALEPMRDSIPADNTGGFSFKTEEPPEIQLGMRGASHSTTVDDAVRDVLALPDRHSARKGAPRIVTARIPIAGEIDNRPNAEQGVVSDEVVQARKDIAEAEAYLEISRMFGTTGQDEKAKARAQMGLDRLASIVELDEEVGEDSSIEPTKEIRKSALHDGIPQIDNYDGSINDVAGMVDRGEREAPLMATPVRSGGSAVTVAPDKKKTVLNPNSPIRYDAPGVARWPVVEEINEQAPDEEPPADFAPQPAAFDSVAVIKSPVVMRGIYAGRAPSKSASEGGKQDEKPRRPSPVEHEQSAPLDFLLEDASPPGSGSYEGPRADLNGNTVVKDVAENTRVQYAADPRATHEQGKARERVVTEAERKKAVTEAYRQFKNLTWDYPACTWAKHARGRLSDPVFADIEGDAPTQPAAPPPPPAPVEELAEVYDSAADPDEDGFANYPEYGLTAHLPPPERTKIEALKKAPPPAQAELRLGEDAPPGAAGFLPMGAKAKAGAPLDSDGDGLSDVQELFLSGTDPKNRPQKEFINGATFDGMGLKKSPTQFGELDAPTIGELGPANINLFGAAADGKRSGSGAVERERVVTEADVHYRYLPAFSAAHGERLGSGEAREEELAAQRLQERLKKIKIPEVDFRQANIQDVVAFLNDAAVEYDADEEKEGANIILQLDPHQPAAATPRPHDEFAMDEAAPDGGDTPLITFSAREISADEALKIVTQVANLKYRIDGDKIVVVPNDAPDDDIIVRMYDVAPTVMNKMGGIVAGLDESAPDKDRTKEPEQFFREMGVAWPTGSSIKHVPSIGKMVVANTPDNHEAVDKALKSVKEAPDRGAKVEDGRSSGAQAEARFRIAQMLEQAGRKGDGEPLSDRALAEYTKLAQQYPDSEFAVPALGKIIDHHIQAEDFQAANDILEKVFVDYQDETFLDSMLMKWAVVAYRTGDLQKAQDKCQQLVLEYPGSTYADKAKDIQKRIKEQLQQKEEEKQTGRFKAFGVNPFYDTAGREFSTFAIDVDTASYTLTRNYMQRGFLPPAEAVRTEEFVNFFDYGYAPPRHGTFAIYSDCAPSKFGRGLQMLKIGVKGRRLGREEKRPAVLTFLIDTSGSMNQPDRLELVKSSLRMLVNKLGPKDMVAIVQYDSDSRLVLEHTVAADKKKLLDAIDALQCGGATNLEKGMNTAYRIAANAFAPGAENRVLLLSDGVANLGTGAAQEILRSVEQYRTQGIFCSVFGFGIGTYDDEMLESLANKGNGSYTFIDSETEARRVFVDDLAATLNTIASDVKIQVEFNPKYVKRYRQLGYENRQLKKKDFRNDAVDAGEVGSGQSVTALYELDLHDEDADALRRGSDWIAMVRVRYRRTDTGEVEEIERPVGAPDICPNFEKANVHFKLASCAAEFAEILRGSPYTEGTTFEDVARVLRPVGLALNLDERVQELARMVQGAGTMSRGE